MELNLASSLLTQYCHVDRAGEAGGEMEQGETKSIVGSMGGKGVEGELTINSSPAPPASPATRAFHHAQFPERTSRRIVMTVGNACTGKSTVIKLLIEMWQHSGKTIKIYVDNNCQKLGAYKELVTTSNLNSLNDETDKIWQELGAKHLDVIIIDMPGQDIDKICRYLEECQWFYLLNCYGWKLTFMQTISSRADCINYLNKLLEFAAINANYVVVKNHYFDTRFTLYQQSMHSKIQLIGGTEVELTALHRDHYQAIERLGKPYSNCCKDASIYVVYRSYIYRWINSFVNCVNNSSARKYLGME